MRLSVDNPQVTCVVESNCVWIFEDALTPGRDELSLWCENLNRYLAPVERPYISIRSNYYAGHCCPFASGRFFQRPTGINLVADGIIDARIRHGMLRLSERCDRRQQRKTKQRDEEGP